MRTEVLRLASFCVLSSGLLVAPLEVSAEKTHYNARHIHWREGAMCAFSPQPIGTAAIGDNGEIVDIHELYDHRGRTIGFVYITRTGSKTYQANPLMPIADIKRLHLYHWQWLWSQTKPYDPQIVKLPERECLPSHVGRAGWDTIYNYALPAYRYGFDYIPYSHLSITKLHTPYLDEEDNHGK